MNVFWTGPIQLLELQSVWRDFSQGPIARPVLRDVSFKISTREIVAILGSSGSGKSTLMNLMGLMDKPTRGKIFLEQQSTTTLNPEETAALRNQKIGFVFQSFHLLPNMSVTDNVGLPLVFRGCDKRDRRRAAHELLERFGLEGHADKKPGQLSGGQRQRVAISRALVGKPKVLLADEPTGNLDSITAHEVMDTIMALNSDSGLTVVIITHDPTIASRCVRQINIRDGQVVQATPNLMSV